MHYYFHLRIGEALDADQIGLDLPDLETAYLEAFRAAQEMWTELLAQRSNPLARTFEIADEDGQVLMTVPFSEVLDRARRPAPPPRPAQQKRPAHAGALQPRPRTTALIESDGNAAYCIERASGCRNRAEHRNDPVYVRLEQSWILLAESHEVVRRTSTFIHELDKRDRVSWGSTKSLRAGLYRGDGPAYG